MGDGIGDSKIGSGTVKCCLVILARMSGHRKRVRRFEDGRARFVTFSTFDRLPLFQNDAIKDRFAESLAAARKRENFELYAWIVMPEHVHLLIRSTAQPLAPILAGLKSGFAKSVLTRWRALDAPVLARITDRSGRPRFWQRGGGYDRNIRDDDEFHEKISYIHANPVRRGLVVSPTHWKWSSARWYEGDTSGPVPIDRPGATTNPPVPSPISDG